MFFNAHIKHWLCVSRVGRMSRCPQKDIKFSAQKSCKVNLSRYNWPEIKRDEDHDSTQTTGTQQGFVHVTECIVCVQGGHDPFLSFQFLFWLGGSFMALIIWSVTTCALGPPRPLSPSVPAVAGRQLVRAAAFASDSGERLHCFLVGKIKSYVIATADLWLFIHASNMLPSLPASLP